MNSGKYQYTLAMLALLGPTRSRLRSFPPPFLRRTRSSRTTESSSGYVITSYSIHYTKLYETDEALKYIDWNVTERPDEPFFLYFPTTAIHTPIVPSEDFAGKSGVAPYGDFVMELDDAVGRVLTKVEEHGIRNNTLIIFTSDNGGHA